MTTIPSLWNSLRMWPCWRKWLSKSQSINFLRTILTVRVHRAALRETSTSGWQRLNLEARLWRFGLFLNHRTFFRQRTQDYIARARDAIIKTIDAADNQQSFESTLPESTLGYFDKLGRSLKGNEVVEFNGPDGMLSASLSRDVRRRLVLASPKVKELTEETSIRGTVPEADQDDMTFEIQLTEGRKVKAPIASQHLDTILEVFNGYQHGVRALFQGIGRFSRVDQLIGFDSVEHLSVLDPLDFGAQLDELRLLQDGWLDGDGKAPSSDGLEWLNEAFECNYPDEIPLPHLYPTETGGVQAEWSLKPNEISLDLNLETHVGEWHALNLTSDDISERTLNFDDDADWRWLVNRIRNMTLGDP